MMKNKLYIKMYIDSSTSRSENKQISWIQKDAEAQAFLIRNFN